MNKYSRYYQRLYTGGWKCGKNIRKKLCIIKALIYTIRYLILCYCCAVGKDPNSTLFPHVHQCA